MLAGDKTAAIQRLDSGGCGTVDATICTLLYLLLLVQLLLYVTHPLVSSGT